MSAQMQFDRNKLRAVILRTCELCPPDKLGAVKLHKVLYFLDMLAYARSGTAVTGAEYRKRPFGPTCVQLLPTLRLMERAGELAVAETDYYGFRKQEFQALTPPEPHRLSTSEELLLEAVVDFVCNQNTARSISEASHQLPWEIAEFGETIGYDTALMLLPSQPSVEAMDLIEREAGAIEAARSNGNSVDRTPYRDFRSRVLSQIGAA